MKIYAYKPGSRSARDLSEALGIRRIKHRGSRFRPSPRHTVINWGCGHNNWPDDLYFCNIINNPQQVTTCSNKLRFFQLMSEGDNCPRLPEFTSSPGRVLQDLEGSRTEGTAWVARTVLQGHSGEGIILIDGADRGVPEAPLYVRYKKKQQEFRVHVFRGEVVDIQRKARSREVPDDQVNWQVRNHHNGFIFARNEGLEPPQDVIDQSILCMNKSGLDFGAVDVIYNEREQLAYVLEINTAPGVTGTTLQGYVDRFRGLM